MTIQINYEAERKLDIDYEKLASEVAEHILETENCPYDVCVNQTGKYGISLNRGTDRCTFFPDDPV